MSAYVISMLLFVLAAPVKPAPGEIRVELQLTEEGPRVFWDLGKGRVSTRIEDLKKALAGCKFDQAVIQAGKTVPYAALVQVIDALRVAGVEEFSIAAMPPEKVDPEEAWREACAELEALSEYRPFPLRSRLIDELLSWVDEGKSIRVYDEDCRPIDVMRHEDELAGDVDIKESFHEGIKRVEARTAHFRYSISYTGPGWTDYEKNEKGKWEEVGGGGAGCFEPRSGLLSRVTKEAAWYDGAEVSLKVSCRWVTEETSPCIGGGKRICRHCRSLRVEVLQARHLRQYPGEATIRQSGSKPLDCSAPCPKNTLIETRDRLNRYLEGKAFFGSDVSGEGAVLFRSLKACRRHRSNRPARH